MIDLYERHTFDNRNGRNVRKNIVEQPPYDSNKGNSQAPLIMSQTIHILALQLQNKKKKKSK